MLLKKILYSNAAKHPVKIAFLTAKKREERKLNTKEAYALNVIPLQVNKM